MFTLPLLILALDGIVSKDRPINRNLYVCLHASHPIHVSISAVSQSVAVRYTEADHSTDRFAADFLQVIAGLGCFVSSMITLLIFFPRSIVREAGYKPKVSSSVGQSPKSPPITPPLRAPYTAYASAPVHHHLPPHMAGYATPNGLRMSVTGGTGASGMTWEMEGSAYTASMYSPRESLYDSPQYTAEDEGGMQRRRRTV